MSALDDGAGRTAASAKLKSTVTPPLACTVRDCGLLLERRGSAFVCARGHSYDVARSGYVSLLQPQDRKSLQAGDSADAVAARARLLAAGVGASLVNRIVDRAASLLGVHGVVVDLGAGSGEVLARLTERVACTAIGVDLSTAAADYASRRFPNVTWVVANADRRLPFLDRSVDLAVSLHGRRNPSECERVLTRTGALVVAVPASDDLIELRAAIQGEGIERDRSAALVQEHARQFELVEQFELRERRRIGKPELGDLLRGTYRGARRSAAARLDALDAIEVTLASTVLLFHRRS